MKTLTLLFALALCGSSSTLPVLGGQVLAISGSTWSVDYSDQLGLNQVDFGAAVATISFDVTDSTATLEYLSSDSPNLDFLRVATPLGDDGTWILPGNSETFTLPSTTFGLPWPNAPIVYVELLDATYPYPQLSTGPGNLNPDGYAHAEVTETISPTATPEPAGWMLMLFGAALVGVVLSVPKIRRNPVASWFVFQASVTVLGATAYAVWRVIAAVRG